MGDLALAPPRTQADLGRVGGLASGWATNDIGRRLVEALQSAGPLDPDEMPQRDGARPGMGKDSALIADLLKLLLKRSEEHTSELQSLMRISYAVFCLKKKKT